MLFSHSLAPINSVLLCDNWICELVSCSFLFKSFHRRFPIIYDYLHLPSRDLLEISELWTGHKVYYVKKFNWQKMQCNTHVTH